MEVEKKVLKIYIVGQNLLLKVKVKKVKDNQIKVLIKDELSKSKNYRCSISQGC